MLLQIQLPSSSTADLSPSDSSDFTSEDEVKKGSSSSNSSRSITPTGQEGNFHKPCSGQDSSHSASSSKGGSPVKTSNSSDDRESNSGTNSGKLQVP